MTLMNNDQIIAIYEDAFRLTREMLLAARDSDWERLVACEKDCAARLAPLVHDQPAQAPTSAFQQRKASLIRAMLHDDAQIRLLVDPWLARLATLIGDSHRQSRLHQTYGAAQ